MKTTRTSPPPVPPALGNNPLALGPDGRPPTADADDPFLTALSAIEAQRRRADEDSLSAPDPLPSRPDLLDRANWPEAAESGPETDAPRQAGNHRPDIRPISPLREIPLPEPRDIFDRLTSDEMRRRLIALAPLVDASVGYDAHGLSLEALRRAAPVFERLYHHYFRVDSVGHEHVPADGPVILASNHAGLLPFDGAMIVTDLLLRPEAPRLARSVIDRFVGDLPWVNVFMARMGQVIGQRTTVRDLLACGQPVLIFPEGTKGVLKTIQQRHRLQPFHPGFIREALRAGAPVVPMAVLGSDDQSPILTDLKPLARLLGLPGFPITPTFPWLGPLGLMPYPVRYRIVYGEPIELGDPPRGVKADNPRHLARLADRVRRRIQGLVNQHAGKTGAGA